MALLDGRGGGAHSQVSGQTAFLPSVEVSSVVADCDIIDVRGMRRGSLLNEEVGVLTLAYYSLDSPADTPRVLEDSSNNAITTAAKADTVTALDVDVESIQYLILVEDDGTGTVSVYLQG